MRCPVPVQVSNKCKQAIKSGFQPASTPRPKQIPHKTHNPSRPQSFLPPASCAQRLARCRPPCRRRCGFRRRCGLRRCAGACAGPPPQPSHCRASHGPTPLLLRGRKAMERQLSVKKVPEPLQKAALLRCCEAQGLFLRTSQRQTPRRETAHRYTQAAMAGIIVRIRKLTFFLPTHLRILEAAQRNGFRLMVGQNVPKAVRGQNEQLVGVGPVCVCGGGGV